MKNIVACILLAAGTLACAQAKNLAGDVNAAAGDAGKAAKEAEEKAAAEKAAAEKVAAEADAAAKLAASLDDALATNAKLVEGALLIDVRAADKATDMLATAKNIPAAEWDKRQADFDTLTGGDKAKGVVIYSEDGADALQIRDKLKAAGHTAVWAQAKAALVVTEARAKGTAEVKDAVKDAKKKKSK
ncbi:MAG: rhodanese-like domain-containing protein [Deltaproteobacteria bacterium]|nr:rhodanese-like domain-containing protein [Deltaproteobacteria bacterium]